MGFESVLHLVILMVCISVASLSKELVFPILIKQKEGAKKSSTYNTLLDF